jgi:hypothetical protein
VKEKIILPSEWYQGYPEFNLLEISAWIQFPFLGAFAQFRKRTVSFIMSFRPHGKITIGRIFMKFDI